MPVQALRTVIAGGLGLAVVLVGGAAVAESADVTVTFDENVPTDSFRIANTSLCRATVTAITIDLAGSAGGLVFDTAPGGEGVNAYEPFGLRAGGEIVTEVTPVADGDRSLTLTFSALAPGSAVEVTIDVDDRLVSGPLGQAQVAGAEISGATVTATLVWPAGAPQRASGTFGADAVARIAGRSCAVS